MTRSRSSLSSRESSVSPVGKKIQFQQQIVTVSIFSTISHDLVAPTIFYPKLIYPKSDPYELHSAAAVSL